jgi:hypothetical protein
MFLDALGLVSDAQVIATGPALSTNVIDLGASTPSRQIGTGEPMGFGVGIDAGATGTTVLIEVIQSDAPALSAPDVIAVMTAAAGQFPTGRLLFVAIPQGQPTKRYIGLRYTAGTMTVTAWLTRHDMFSILAQPYAKNYAV